MSAERRDETEIVETAEARRLAETFTVKFVLDAEGDESSTAKDAPSCVDNEDTDEASSSPQPPRKEVVVDFLFFLGKGGSIFPGNSVRIRLWSFTKSPYLRPT